MDQWLGRGASEPIIQTSSFKVNLPCSPYACTKQLFRGSPKKFGCPFWPSYTGSNNAKLRANYGKGVHENLGSNMSLVSDPCLRLVIYQMCVASEHLSRTKWKWDTWLNCEFAVRKKVKALLSCNPFSCWFPSKMARVSPLAFLTTKKIAYIRLLCPLYLVLLYYYTYVPYISTLCLWSSLTSCLCFLVYTVKIYVPINIIRTFWIKLKF